VNANAEPQKSEVEVVRGATRFREHGNASRNNETTRQFEIV
jgi:hypothetical protein